MNLQHLKLLHEDDKSWHVHDMKRNESFRVGKKGLNNATRNQIVQHFAEGGEAKKVSNQLRADEVINDSPDQPELQAIDRGEVNIQNLMRQNDIPGNRLALETERWGAGKAREGTKAALKSNEAAREAAWAEWGIGKAHEGTEAAKEAAKYRAGPPKFDERGRPIGEKPEFLGNAQSAVAQQKMPWDALSPGEAQARVQQLNTNRDESAYRDAIQAGSRPPGAAPVDESAMSPAQLTDFSRQQAMGPMFGPLNNPAGAPSSQGQGQANPAAPQPQAVAAPVQSPVQKAAGGGGGMGGYGALTAAGKEENKSIQAQADIAEKMAKEKLAQQQDYAQKAQASNAYWEGLARKNLADMDRTQKDIASGKIDPNQWWHQGGVGRQITGTIAMILGGIGSAFGGGPNQALQLIERSIDRNIDAQKAELGKKQTMLGHYIAQGHSIQQAEELTRAHNMAAFAGQLEQVATANAGPQAQAIAQGLKAEVNKKTFQNTMQAHIQGAELGLKNIQMTMARQGMEQQKLMRAALQEYAKGGPPSMLLPKEITEKAVSLPGGGRGFAGSPKDAEEARKVFGLTDQLRAKISRYSALLEKGAGRFGPTDLDAADAMRASVLADLGHLHDLNRLSDRDLELFMKQVPDIRTPQVGSGHRAKLQLLGEDIDNKVMSTMKNMLQMGGPVGAAQPMVSF